MTITATRRTPPAHGPTNSLDMGLTIMTDLRSWARSAAKVVKSAYGWFIIPTKRPWKTMSTPSPKRGLPSIPMNGRATTISFAPIPPFATVAKKFFVDAIESFLGIALGLSFALPTSLADGSAIAFALYANRLGSLIEAVNILGSLFYGTILGIFLVALYVKKASGTATFMAAVVAESLVMALYFFTGIPYLWYNVIGCATLVFLAILMKPLFFATPTDKPFP